MRSVAVSCYRVTFKCHQVTFLCNQVTTIAIWYLLYIIIIIIIISKITDTSSTGKETFFSRIAEATHPITYATENRTTKRYLGSIQRLTAVATLDFFYVKLDLQIKPHRATILGFGNFTRKLFFCFLTC